MKTILALLLSLSLTGLLWVWTARNLTTFRSTTNQRFVYVQAHQGDGLHSMICYFEKRTIHSGQLTSAQKADGVRTLEVALRKALLPGCTSADLGQ